MEEEGAVEATAGTVQLPVPQIGVRTWKATDVCHHVLLSAREEAGRWGSTSTPLPVDPATKPPIVTSGEHELFHGSPAHALPQLAAGEGPRTRWLLGAALGALGRYGEARRALSGCLNGPYASLAASTLASHYRQLGRHDEAPGWDQRALELAGENPEALWDARIGLAADAVGAGDLAAARARLVTAGGEATAGGEGPRRSNERPASRHWRRRVRYGWVETEIALLAGDPSEACRVAETALTIAEDAAAPRHVAKCLLFLGASRHVAGDAGADTTLRRASQEAAAVGALPLYWVAEYLLSQRGTAEFHLARSAAAILEIAAGLPDDDRKRWLDRVDIAGIVAVTT
jgi:hypothetical protein